MHDHQGAVAALLIGLGLVAWYALRERRDRIRAEAERDLYEEELERQAAGDHQVAMLRDRRLRRGHASGTRVETLDGPFGRVEIVTDPPVARFVTRSDLGFDEIPPRHTNHGCSVTPVLEVPSQREAAE